MNPIISTGESNTERTPLLSHHETRENPHVVNGDAPEASLTPQDAPASGSPTRWTVIPVLFLGVFLVNFDNFFVIVSSSSIVSEFDAFSAVGWILNCGSIAACAVQPVYGRTSDIFGRRTMLLVAYAFFMSGCLISGLANSLAPVLVGRAIGGIGTAGMIVLVSIVIADTVPVRHIAQWLSYMNIAGASGRALGSSFGGVMTDVIGWRWVFLAEAPITGLVFVLVWLLLPSPSAESEGSQLKPTTAVEKLRRVDFLGAGTLCALMVSLLLLIHYANEMDSETKALVGILALLTVILAAAFWAVETKLAKEPIFPMSLLADRDVLTPYFVQGFQLAAQISVLFSVPIYFRVLGGLSNGAAGTKLLASVTANTIGAFFSGFIIRQSGHYKWTIFSGIVLGCICYTLLILRWNGHTNLFELLYLVPGGFGTAMVTQAGFVSLNACVKPSDMAAAAVGYYTSGAIGILVAVGVVTAVLQGSLRAQLTAQLVNYPDQEQIISNVARDIGYVMGLKGDLRTIVLQAYAKSLTYMHAVSLSLAGVALLICLLIRERRI